MSLQLDLNSFDLIRITSIALNAFFLYLWVKDRVLLRRFLVGKWEGHFKHTMDDSIFICQLIVAEQNDRDNAAFFYYEAKRLGDGVLLLRGLDKLQDYTDDFWFVKNRRWNARFVREFNKSSNNGDSSDNVPPYYSWTCDIVSLFFRPKMSVTINADGRVFEGLLSKV